MFLYKIIASRRSRARITNQRERSFLMGSDGFWFSDKKRKEEEEAEEGPAVVVVVPHVCFFFPGITKTNIQIIYFFFLFCFVLCCFCFFVWLKSILNK